MTELAPPAAPGPYPDVRSFADVLVVPYAHLMEWRRPGLRHVGGPIWPDWDAVSPARHFLGDAPADARPASCAPEAVREGDGFFWIGPVHPHFGHQVAEFSSRILPSLLADPRAILVFSAQARSPFLRSGSTPVHFRALLDWHGVPPERVLIVDRPTLFRRLHVAAQPERLVERIAPDAPMPGPAARAAAAPHPAHVEALTAHARSRLGEPTRTGVVFVSRTGHVPGLTGESGLDLLFELSGARVFRPERHPLREQLAVYASAATLVFTEGSAAHALQLLGRNLGRVVVICRRPGSRFGESFIPPRAAHFEIVDAIEGVINGSNRINRAMPAAYGLGLPDVDRLLAGLAEAGLELRPHFDARRHAAAAAEDLRAWLRTSGAFLIRLDRRARLEIARCLVRRRPEGWTGALASLAVGPLKRRLRRST